MNNLTAARLALAALQADPETPIRVLEAGNAAIQYVEWGLSVPPHLRAILIQHASTRQQQDRYGK